MISILACQYLLCHYKCAVAYRVRCNVMLNTSDLLFDTDVQFDTDSQVGRCVANVYVYAVAL